MKRRAFLPLVAAARVARTERAGLKLSIRVEALFPKLALEAQMEKVAEAGYQGFEFGDWRAADPHRVVRRKNKLGLECVCLVGNRGVNPEGMGLCDPAEREGFLAELRASAEAAVRFECRRLVVLTGYKRPHLSRRQQRASIVEGLKRAHEVVSRHGVTMLLEVINTLAPVEPLNPRGDNHADYFLDRTAEAFRILREVGSPYLKLLYDFYHVQIMEGNLIRTIQANLEAIGHFHVGDVPGRHQPGTGEINYPNVFRAIRESGYTGWVGMEYVPSGDATQTLRRTRSMASS